MSEKIKESAENVALSMTNSEKERIRRDIYRSDIEKLSLFYQDVETKYIIQEGQNHS